MRITWAGSRPPSVYTAPGPGTENVYRGTQNQASPTGSPRTCQQCTVCFDTQVSYAHVRLNQQKQRAWCIICNPGTLGPPHGNSPTMHCLSPWTPSAGWTLAGGPCLTTTAQILMTRTDETGHWALGLSKAPGPGCCTQCIRCIPFPPCPWNAGTLCRSPRAGAVLLLLTHLLGSPGTALPLESSADRDASCTLASDAWGPLPSTGERVGPCLHLRPLAPLHLFLASFSLGPQASSLPPELPPWPTLAPRQVLSPRIARAGHSRRFQGLPWWRSG